MTGRRSSRRSLWRSVAAASLAAAAVLGVLPGHAHATVIQTRQSASSYWSRMPLVIGLAYEFDIDEEQAVSDFPLLIEYNLAEWFQIVIEPNLVYEKSRVQYLKTNKGLGDLETRFELEFVTERRYRPAMSLEGGVKWPTASSADIGSAGRDYTAGLIVSKDFVFVDVDFNSSYTYSGDPLIQSKIEISAATHVEIGPRVELEGEIMQAIGLGPVVERSSGISRLHGGLTETAATVAVAEHLINHHLKVEEGATFFNDLSWQVIFGLEWSFAGED
jgi:hypothetical protein